MSHVNNPPFPLTSCITRCSCLEVLKRRNI